MKYNHRNAFTGKFEVKRDYRSAEQRIKELVENLIRNKFCGIVSFGPWCHTRNAVLNCYALMLDGGVQYKFSLTYDGKLLVAEIRSRQWIDMNIQPGDVITFEELETKYLPEAKLRNVVRQSFYKTPQGNIVARHQS